MACAKILIVDDSDDVQEFCQIILQNKYELHSAANVKEAEDFLAHDKPDLILLDIYMPRVDGLMLAEQIKADPRLSDIPIIMMSGLVADTDLPAGFWKMGTPAERFLHKPIEPATLLAEVERALAKSSGINLSKSQAGGYL